MKSLTTREVRHKLELMAFIIFLTRAISMIPVPGVNALMFKQWMAANSMMHLTCFQRLPEVHLKTFQCSPLESRRLLQHRL